MLAQATGRPCHLMQRGVDDQLFSPTHREVGMPNDSGDPVFTLGYVGRLSIEKNVALLPRIQRELSAAGLKVRFLVVGHGAEEDWLRRELAEAEFAGVLRGLELSRAYARMDVFVFPSHTDTFGNVVLEALASGVPAIVTPDGGPRTIVQARGASDAAPPETGIIAADCDFGAAIAGLLRDPVRLAAMRTAARAYAATCSWDAVFDRVYAAYGPLLEARLDAGVESGLDARRGGEGSVSSPGRRLNSPIYTP